jgi:hypothetical protein
MGYRGPDRADRRFLIGRDSMKFAGKRGEAVNGAI